MKRIVLDEDTLCFAISQRNTEWVLQIICPLYSLQLAEFMAAVVFAGCRLSLGLSVGFLLSVLAVFLSGFERFFRFYFSFKSGFLKVLIFRFSFFY